MPLSRSTSTSSSALVRLVDEEDLLVDLSRPSSTAARPRRFGVLEQVIGELLRLLGIVAEKNSVWRWRGRKRDDAPHVGMKPMSSMRSA